MVLKGLAAYEIKDKEWINFKIANINISVVFPCSKERILINKSYQSFISTVKNPDIIIHTFYGKIPKITLPEQDFLAGVADWWSFYQSEGKKIFLLYPVGRKKRTFSIMYKKFLNYKDRNSTIELKLTHDFDSINAILPLPYRIAIFNSDFREGTTYVNSSNSSMLPNPIEYPLLDLLLAELLFLKQGIKLHACGVIDGEQCYLFLGKPRKGKSTIAKLWQTEGIVLNDDRVPVRKLGNNFFAFPAPGYGVNPRYISEGVPISKIFFLHHGRKNIAFRQTSMQAVSMFLSSTPVVTWDNSILKQTINFFVQLSQAVPCYSLHFVPDRRILELVKKVT